MFKPTKTEAVITEVATKLNLPETSPILNLNDNEKKQVIQLLDLERNAAILEKTDQAIAAKLNVKNSSLAGRVEKFPLTPMGVLAPVSVE